MACFKPPLRVRETSAMSSTPAQLPQRPLARTLLNSLIGAGHRQPRGAVPAGMASPAQPLWMRSISDLQSWSMTRDPALEHLGNRRETEYDRR